MSVRACQALAIAMCFAAIALAKKRGDDKAAFDYATRLGVVEVSSPGQVCLTVKNSKLKPGDPVAVISREGEVEQAQITARVDKSCSHDPTTSKDDVFYRLDTKRAVEV